MTRHSEIAKTKFDIEFMATLQRLFKESPELEVHFEGPNYKKQFTISEKRFRPFWHSHEARQRAFHAVLKQRARRRLVSVLLSPIIAPAVALSRLFRHTTASTSGISLHWPSFPRIWGILAYLLPKRIREKVYDPCRNELLEDYLVTRRKYRTKWSRRFLGFCFTVRTVVAVADCLRVWALDKGLQFLLKLVPDPLRQWWFRNP